MAQIPRKTTILEKSQEGSKFFRRTPAATPVLGDHTQAARAIVEKKPVPVGSVAPTQLAVPAKGGGTPTISDHIDAATALVQGSSRGDIGAMPMGYADENDASGNPYQDASKIAPWNKLTN